MDFMDKVSELSKKVGEGAEKTYKVVADKSGKIIKETKIRIKANDLEAEIEGIYYDMGRETYKMYKDGAELTPGFTKSCKKIEKIQKEIESIEIKTLYLRDLRKCSNCNEIIEINNKFCPKCGDKQKTIKIKEEKRKEEKVDKPLEKICPKCSKMALDDEVFCTECRI